MPSLHFTSSIAKPFLELLFPSFCLGCQKEGAYLCQDCKTTLEISEHRYCLCNKDPLRLPPENTKGICGRCSNKKLSGLFSALAYKEKALTRKLIRQFKYDPYLKGLASIFTAIIAEHLILTNAHHHRFWEGGALIAIPLEKSRMKSRGYNQSEMLASELSKLLNIPSIAHNLIKIKKTDSQTNLSAHERQKNVQGAFLARNSREIKGKTLFLVDDVYTTGSTMEEAARTLREAGAKSVFGIAIAREG